MGICRHHPVRLNTPERPIVDQYREGKVKRTPNRGMKENLKPCTYELLLSGKVKRLSRGSEAKASLNRAYSQRG